MKPIGRRAASSTIFAGALLILSAVFTAGCATTGRPAPLDLPTAAAVDPNGKTPPGLMNRTGTSRDMTKQQSEIRNSTFNLESVLLR